LIKKDKFFGTGKALAAYEEVKYEKGEKDGNVEKTSNKVLLNHSSYEAGKIYID